MKTPKLIILLSFILLAFTIGDSKSEYIIPAYGRTLISGDIDLDGDVDIVTGHNYFWQTEWGGSAFICNIGNGYYNFYDSVLFEHGFPDINCDYIDNNNYLDIYSTTVTTEPYNIYISIIYNYGQVQFDSIKSFPIYPEPPVSFITSGDVDADGFVDLLFAHNNDFLWGIIYNDGTGNFSVPEYFDLDYPPLDIACADLNGDGRDDVVIAADRVEVYFSTENGFQQLLLGSVLPLSGLGGHIISISDFDNDNDIDVLYYATLNSNKGVEYMYENLGNNQFYEHPYFEFSPFCSYAQIADFDNDSLPDMVFIAQDNSGLFIYHNIGVFQLEYDQFIPIENSSSKGLNCNDFDNNGFNDIAIIKDGIPQSTLQLLFNDGQGGFQENPITNIEIPAVNQNNPINCYPNPFSGKTNIEINIDFNEQAILEIYDIQGKQIKAFDDMAFQTGVHKFIWESKDQSGKEVKPGLYFLRLRSGRKVYTKRLVLLK